MEETGISRVSSCRGVAFEAKAYRNYIFDVSASTRKEHHQSERWIRPAWTEKISAFKVFPGSNSLRKSLGISSRHFCDLEVDEDEKKDYSLSMYLEDASPQDLENNQHLAGKVNPYKQLPKPALKKDRLSVILRDQSLFTVYKRLFIVSLLLNIIGLALAATDYFTYGRRKPAVFSIGNILALTLCRNEAFLRCVFWLAVKLFGRAWIPLWIKTLTTSFLQSLGGIHSGCGVSSIIWLLYAIILTIQHREKSSLLIISVAFSILFFILLSSLAAFPLVRHLHHNVFERIHRFAGWLALVLVWLFVVLTLSYEPSSKLYDFSLFEYVKALELWLTLVITCLIILPWLTVKRVQVRVSSPSGQASIIKFEGGVKAGLLGRISPSPFSEWHAFGIISDGKDEHMMLAGAVGDFTTSLVSNPPTHLWVRTLHFTGLPYLVSLYKKVVLVATGSGICVFLSFLMQPSSTEVCLVWVAKGVEQNFGTEIMKYVSGFPKDKVIVHDTGVLGRPNVAEMSVDAAKKWKAEVVIVTSNPEGSRDVVHACKASGIPAFGPIWDS
ncbi:adenylate-forming reductase 03009 [Heracleum sosnowskyi]|uniref:Adenylate-forming reductase 03009 n=1 Tax=Heracleum sosnowskyi TaxID=360622 RepID=A0AAD8NC08_9APIA|nr:adenylate-forming reductase 03009 [Heracleum sosnowskyi]